MLFIKDLTVKIDDKLIIDHLSLDIKSGEVAILMGPNGSGKSSLAATLMGHPNYKIVSGSILFNGQEIANLLPHERAKLGLFLAFQQPRTICGLQVFSFLKAIYEAYTGNTIAVPEFQALVFSQLVLVGLDQSFMYRDVNDGFSGGEKKRLEILQFLLLQPKLAIIDEIDSGLDVDALKLIAHAIMIAKQNNPELVVLLITHYHRILDYLSTDRVFVLQQGVLIKFGDLDLVRQVERFGYENLI